MPYSHRQLKPAALITSPVAVSVALLAVLIGLWQLALIYFDPSPLVVPSPKDVAESLGRLLTSASTWHDTFVTLTEIIVGFAIAAVSGVLVGALLGKSRRLAASLSPFIVATQVMPKTPLIPIFIIWFGFGISTKVIIAALLAFFPIFSNTLNGVRSTPKGLLDLAEIQRLSATQRFRKIEFPSALPSIMTGFEVGIVLAVIGAVVGEFLGGSEGLGYRAIAAMNNFQTADLFAVILILTLVGYLLNLVVVLLRGVAIPWHESAREGN